MARRSRTQSGCVVFLGLCGFGFWRGNALPFGPSPRAEKRKAEAARIKEKYPDRIPVRSSSRNVRASLARPRAPSLLLLATWPGRVTQVASLRLPCPACMCATQVIVEKAEKSDIPDIDKKK